MLADERVMNQGAQSHPPQQPASRTRARGSYVQALVTGRLQTDEAQRQLLHFGGDTRRAVDAVRKGLGVSHHRAERLVTAAKLCMRKDATHTTREQSLDLVRGTLRDVITMARERKKVVVTHSPDGSEVHEYPDPDLRAMTDAAKAIAVLDDVAGEREAAGMTQDELRAKLTSGAMAGVVVLSEAEVEAELQAHRRAQRDG